jgi:2-dehydro-3-deoxygluconokinase
MSAKSPAKQVVVFGELLMRLQTKRNERLIQAREFDIYYSGAETNVAVALHLYGVQTHIVSSVPDSMVGQACINYIRQFGLGIDHIKRAGSRLGIYYVETGAAQRASTVTYDRKGSSITELRKGDFDWERIFEGKHWFHFSGTAPALGDNVAEVTSEACAAAKKLGLTVSCDLNYRKYLWPQEKANRVMSSLMRDVDVLFTNEEEADKVFNLSASGSDVTQGKIDSRGYEQVAVKLREKFDLTHVAISLRESLTASANIWSGMLFDGSNFHLSRRYRIEPIVDRVGGGDAYSAGVIYGLLAGHPLSTVVEFAAAASCLKHSIHGDFNLTSMEEVLSLMKGDGSGRIQR